jgi:GMP synthase (glutamine-hydrolysing)
MHSGDPMRPLAVFVTGSPSQALLPRIGSFATLVKRTIRDEWPGEWVEIDCVRSEPMDLHDFAGIVVTGSPASVVDDAPWMQRTAGLLRHAVARALPVFGICFGHQLLARALGGKVAKNPRGREIGTIAVEVLVSDSLLGERRTMLVQSTHVDSVVELPAGATLLGRSRVEPCAAVRFAPKAWGVQFHPEFSADVVRQYLAERHALLVEEGLDPEALARATLETPEGGELLRRFARLVVRSQGG